MAFEWNAEPEQVLEEMGQEYAAAIHAAVFQLAQRYAPEIESWMKANAPWTDRTGNARQTLYAEVEDLIGSIVITFGHGVDYGKWLELSFGGRYSILSPALDHFTPLIRRDVQELIR